jgi:serine protease Do
MNLMNPVKLAFVFSLLAFASLVHAQIYQWVDEDGKVRFSDKPPPGQAAGEEISEDTVQPGSKHKSSGRDYRRDIVRAEDDTHSVKLEVLKYQLDDSELDKDIGLQYGAASRNAEVSALCGSKTKPLGVSYAQGLLRASLPGSEKLLNRLLKDHGYQVIDSEASVFANQRAELAEISLAALVKKAHFEVCHVGQSHGSSKSFNRSNITVEWQLFDKLRREVILHHIVEGEHDGFNELPVVQGKVASFENALMDSAQAMLASNEFYNAVKKESNSNQAGFASQGISVNFQYGNQETSFIDKSASVKKGAVTIRTPSGHGSGFFVSGDGKIITNEHVVGANKEVMVITSTGEELAHVLHTDAMRDVALIQVNSRHADHPLQISQKEARIGEQIYVVGTPLSEDLSFSVTRGIVSGNRETNGLPLLQTDAAVNPGNSGGPVLDQFGNVVGIAVSGIFSRSGGSLNTNFLIPINDALERLR